MSTTFFSTSFGRALSFAWLRCTSPRFTSGRAFRSIFFEGFAHQPTVEWAKPSKKDAATIPHASHHTNPSSCNKLHLSSRAQSRDVFASIIKFIPVITLSSRAQSRDVLSKTINQSMQARLSSRAQSRDVFSKTVNQSLLARLSSRAQSRNVCASIIKFIPVFTLSSRAQSRNFLFKICVFVPSIIFSQTTQDSTKTNQLDEVLISSIRATSKTPVSFSNLSAKDIKSRNLGQDIPILMNFMPSVVTTSDAGNGVGYTGIRVRGSDATRVNVTINGIPYNDPEGHGTFWVNMPDFASSVESLQLQRGVGTSTNGAGAFGASLNVLTDNFKNDASAEVSNSVGSFNTIKNTVKFSSGLLNNHFEMAGRLSRIKSDGFVDRASSDLKSYFLQGSFINQETIIKALFFGGTEKTYQSWNGIDAETLARNRTYNSAGQFTDEFGKVRFYDNETDNYQQDHFQLHWHQKFSDSWNTNLAFHYTKGKGFFENYKEDAAMIDYGITPFSAGGAVLNATDLIRQKWLDNDFYGVTFAATYKKNKVDFVVGGGANQYFGRHFGKVIWARFASTNELGDRYYDDTATKNDFNVYAKLNYQVTKKLSLFGDLQLRNVFYSANGIETGNVNDNFVFFNPKFGFTYDYNKNNALYFSYAKAQREPNRVDYAFGTPKPEQLNDFEMGWRHKTKTMVWNANLYYMTYQDQLILTGNLDDVGNPIRSNSEKSCRFGVEVDAKFMVTNRLSIQPNVTLSSNKNLDLRVNDQNFGNKSIAFSPNVVAGNIVGFKASNKLEIAVLSKFVGEQFLNNIESDNARLASYFVNDLNFGYTIMPKKYCKSIVFNALVNNFANRNYVSNGYMYGDVAYYYPQAGINFLVGMTVLF